MFWLGLLFLTVLPETRATKLYGEVWNRYPPYPVANLDVSCYDHDVMNKDDFIGQAKTNQDGKFEIIMRSGGYDVFSKNSADVYCIVSGWQLVHQSRTETHSSTPTNKGSVNLQRIHVYEKRQAEGCRTNGCGPKGWGSSVPDFKFTDACNQHDCCYEMCDSSGMMKYMCDRELHELMLHKCRVDSFPGCELIANGYKRALESGTSWRLWCKKQCSRGCAVRTCTCSDE